MSTDSAVLPDGTPHATPESFRGRTLSVSLTVKDLEKSLAWYRDVAGFTVDQKHERDGKVRAIALKAGTVRILIGQDDGAKGWDRIKGEGFSMRITTDQNVDELASRMRNLGAVLDMEPTDMPWGARAFRLRDPDGYRIAISTEMEADRR